MMFCSVAVLYDGHGGFTILDPKTPLNNEEFQELCDKICKRPNLKRLHGEELMVELKKILITEKGFSPIKVVCGYPETLNKNIFK